MANVQANIAMNVRLRPIHWFRSFNLLKRRGRADSTSLAHACQWGA